MSVTLADNASDWVRAMFRSRVTPQDLLNTTKIIFETVSFDVNEIVDMDGRVYVPQRTCHDTHEYGDFTCSVCGCVVRDTADENPTISLNGRYADLNYCPCCGAKVVDGRMNELDDCLASLGFDPTTAYVVPENPTDAALECINAFVRERTCHSTTDDRAWCFACSECGKSFPRNQLKYAENHGDINYCPNCGAKVLRNVTVPKLAGSITLENLQQSAPEPVENLHTAKIEMRHGDHGPHPLFEGDAWTVWFVCSECTGAVDFYDKYCKHCGAKLEPYERMENGE